jgi:hypothetical protein
LFNYLDGTFFIYIVVRVGKKHVFGGSQTLALWAVFIMFMRSRLTHNGPAIKGVCVAERMKAGGESFIGYQSRYQPE